jgi:hypothetical protein
MRFFSIGNLYFMYTLGMIGQVSVYQCRAFIRGRSCSLVHNFACQESRAHWWDQSRTDS